MDKEDNVGISGALKASIACLVIGCLLMILSLWSIIFYVPLFLASFVLSIVAMAKDEVWAGVGMLLGNLIIPLAIFGIMFTIGINQAFDTDNKIDDTDSVTEIISEAEMQAEKQQQDLQNFKAQYIEKIRMYDFSAKYYEDDFLDKKKAGVTFKLENKGDSTLSYVEVTAFFNDNNGNTIHEESFVPINSNSMWGNNKPFKPNYIWEELGEYGYLPAENVPTKWKEGEAFAKITDIEFVE